MKKMVLLIAVSTVALISLAACAGTGAVAGANQQNLPILNANGTGQVFLVPDVAYINVGVRVDADEVSMALEKNNTQANEISQALQALGVDKKDIQTSNFNVYPMMDYGPDGQVSRRYYVVENTVFITIRDLAKMGEMLDTVVRSGANTINGISFDVIDKTAAQAQARDIAIEAAKAEAEAIAKAAGVKLGKLQNVSVYVSGVTTPVYEAKGIGGAMDYSQSVPVAAGQLKITVEANVAYIID